MRWIIFTSRDLSQLSAAFIGKVRSAERAAYSANIGRAKEQIIADLADSGVFCADTFVTLTAVSDISRA